MADLKTVERAFMKAHAAGDTQAATVLAREVQRQRALATPQTPQMSNTEGKGNRELSIGQTALDAAKSFGTGVGEGVIGMAGLPGDIAAITKRGVEAAAPFVGLDPSAAGQTFAAFNPTSYLPTSGQIKSPIEQNVTGKFYEPKSTTGEVFNTMGQLAPTAATGPGGVIRKAAMDVVPSLAGESASRLPGIKGTKAAPYVKVAAELAGFVGTGAAAGLAKLATETPEAFALRKVAQAAERSNTSLPQATQEVNRIGKTSPDIMLADTLGKSGQRLSRAIINKGGRGAEDLTTALKDRQAGQIDRITQQLKTNLGDPNAYHQSLDTSLEALRTNAKPFYDAAYAKTINYAKDGPAITAAWLKIPERLRAQVVSAANDLLTTEGKQASKIGDVIGRDANGRMTPQPSVEQWDYIKRGLDSVIQGTEGQAASGGMSAFGHSLSRVKNELMATIDNAVPEFKQARQIYSSDLQVKNALEQGRKAITADHELITKQLSKLDASAQSMFRTGYARAILERMGTMGPGHDAIGRIWNAPALQSRLQAVFGSQQKFEQFAGFAKNEQKMGETFNASRANSTTAQQISDLNDAGQSTAIDFGAAAATGGLRHAVLQYLTKQARTLGGLTEKRANAIADILMQKGVTAKQMQMAQSGGGGLPATIRMLLTANSPGSGNQVPQPQ